MFPYPGPVFIQAAQVQSFVAKNFAAEFFKCGHDVFIVLCCLK